MKNKIIFLLVFAVILIKSQTTPVLKRSCATEVPDKAWNDWFNAQVEEFKKSAKKENANYTIPVIFHVIYDNQSEGIFPNISQAQINSQIPILNADFAGKGFNVGNFASTNFNQSLIADCNINFCLAEKDPSGNLLSEKGIERMSYSSKGWASPTSFTTATAFKTFIDNTVKPNSIWDANRYLNIWISDVNANVGLLGFATFPPASGLSGIPTGPGTLLNDGVWCWSKAIGDVGSLVSNYNKGRTATHEIGHYLGLRHIWGDGSCATDYCNDTPTQQQENTTCPTYPHVTCSNGPNGDMFMNFMDYCFDPCLYMFTTDQRTRMQAAMVSSPLRKNLAASAATLCETSSIACSYTVTNFSSTDTLNSFRRLTALSSDTQCPQGAGKAGYIAGTNCYDDQEKAEFISASKYSNVTNPIVTGVIVLFYRNGNKGTNGTGNVGMKIYSGSSVNSMPGALLGSTSESLAIIAASTTTNSVPYCGNPNLYFNVPLILPYKFNFSTNISVPQSGGFFASVVLPTIAGDTVAIIDKRTGTANTAWEKWADNTWEDMKTAWGGKRNYNLAILPVIECGPVGIKKNSLLYNGIDIFPNPSNGDFTLITSLTSSQNLVIHVYNILGEIVYTETMQQAKQNLLEIKMSDSPTGIYFVEVNNGEEKIVKRIIISK